MTLKTYTFGIFIQALVLLAGPVRAAELDFKGDIRPVLSDACYRCHGPDANAREAKLRLDDRVSALEADVLTSGAMLERLTSDDPDVRMPPPESNRRPAAEIGSVCGRERG